ncbi:MAG: creatininase family protein [Nannocystaceae bacterium]
MRGGIGRALAERGYVCLRFPPIHYGVTDWAAMFAGTVSLGADTTAAVVFETCRAAASMGFARVVVTNAHLEPAHIATLRAVAERFADEVGTPLLFGKTRRRQAERLGAEFRSGSCHAGQYESSLVLAIAPALVDLPRAQQPCRTSCRCTSASPRARATSPTAARSGLLRGTPAAATAAEGEATWACSPTWSSRRSARASTTRHADSASARGAAAGLPCSVASACMGTSWASMGIRPSGGSTKASNAADAEAAVVVADRGASARS